ncbi:MAG: hypothetical protein JSW71_16015 [Gemmatimonadota bacterium]|nr:MAG: hypothetical protein JSW71_16015 [Gemmatimonadota bacterium]
MRYVLRPLAVSVLLLLPLVASSGQLHAQTQVVRVVMFFSPSCPHCHDVIQDHLPIFFDVYGGEPRMWVDQSASEAERSLYLMYNEQLEILLVDATRPVGGRLFVADLESHGIPPEEGSVPRMIFGDDVLVGGIEIPSRFHPLMRQAVADGGLDWPPIPGLAELTPAFPTASVAVADSELAARPAADSTLGLAADSALAAGDTIAATVDAAAPTDTIAVADPEVSTARQTQSQLPPDSATAAAAQPDPEAPPTTDTATASESTTAATADTAVGSVIDSVEAVSPVADSAASPFDVVPSRRPTMVENLQRDPVGNGVAVLVLVGMVASVVVIVAPKREQSSWSRPPPAILAVAVLGIVVASYLSYVEASGVTAVCGPVGDCNTVQQSKYAVLLGVVPVGMLGLLAYIAIIVMWFIARSASQPTADYAGLLLLATAFAGTLFSIYLTFLEPFVIGATCAWCLASSVAITILLWLSAGPGKAAWSRLANRQ